MPEKTILRKVCCYFCRKEIEVLKKFEIVYIILSLCYLLFSKHFCNAAAVDVQYLLVYANVTLLLGCKVRKLSGQLGFRFGTWTFVMVSLNLVS
jgi:hypothetical protein